MIARAFVGNCAPDIKTTEVFVLPQVALDIPDNVLFYPDEEFLIDVGINYDGDFSITWTPDNIVPTDITEGWDGKFQGKLLAPGVYIYYVEVLCFLNGQAVLSSGDVTLLR